MGTITTANSILTLRVDTLYPSPQILRGYAVDDGFMSQMVKTVETKVGIDNFMVGGWVSHSVDVEIALLATSPSLSMFETWFASQNAVQEIYIGSMTLNLTGPGLIYRADEVYLTDYSPFSDLRKTASDRKFRMQVHDFKPQNQ